MSEFKVPYEDPIGESLLKIAFFCALVGFIVLLLSGKWTEVGNGLWK